MTDAATALIDDLQAWHDKFLAGQKSYVRDHVETAYGYLEASRRHIVPDGPMDASAAHWFGVIAAELNMLPLLARQTSERTGVQITGVEQLLLGEAAAAITLKTTGELNQWIAAHNRAYSPWPDPADPEVCCSLYGVALTVARGILGETLRVLERIGA